MAFSIARFYYKGWIEECYIKPSYFFTYYGFDWVQLPSAQSIYWIYAALFIFALGIALGAFYRVSTIGFFLLFTFVELLDKTYYLNHYYFVSLISFLLIWVPAHKAFSIDVLRKPALKTPLVKSWTILIFKLQLAMVYIFAGIAKLNGDWLFQAMPLKIWLPSKSATPIIGSLLQEEWVAYAFSWGGAIYDLSIVFFLLYKPTRKMAFLAVLLFHVLTAVLFQIGMFPYIMIFATLIFFSGEVHEKVYNYFNYSFTQQNKYNIADSLALRPSGIILSLFFLIQLILPFRHLAYPGNLFWNEQGYRFSWRVMLMEKSAFTTFLVKDEASEKVEHVNNMDYLSPQQEKMMSTQPDMILQFAHYLGSIYKEKGFIKPAVFCTSKLSLNARPSQVFVDPTINLLNEKRGFKHKRWIVEEEK